MVIELEWHSLQKMADKQVEQSCQLAVADVLLSFELYLYIQFISFKTALPEIPRIGWGGPGFSDQPHAVWDGVSPLNPPP